MSCSGCRVLRKGCSDACILRPSIAWLKDSEAQAHATVFVAKFFGRAGLLSSLSSVPESHRPALFRSLLYEACGRAVSPITGAVGLLWGGNWGACEAAVETVLRGKIPRPLIELECDSDGLYKLETKKRNKASQEASCDDLDLCLTWRSSVRPDGRAVSKRRQRAATPSDESEMTSAESGREHHRQFAKRGRPQLLGLFV